MDPFLGEVSHLAVFGFNDFSAAGLDDIGDTFHQGGFSGTIMTGKGNPLLGKHCKRKILEEDPGSVFDVKVLNGKHRAEGSARK